MSDPGGSRWQTNACDGNLDNFVSDSYFKQLLCGHLGLFVISTIPLIETRSLLQYILSAVTQGMLQFIGLGYVGPKQAGW